MVRCSGYKNCTIDPNCEHSIAHEIMPRCTQRGRMKCVEVCVVCEEPITSENWEEVRRLHQNMLDQVDQHGVESLTENKQVLYANKVHVKCFDQLA